jgi:putative DNA primase/helicase
MSNELFRIMRTNLAADVISLLERGEIPWEADCPGSPGRPYNAVSGRRYAGGNLISVVTKSLERGWTDPRFVSTEQLDQMERWTQTPIHPEQIHLNRVYAPGHPKYVPTWSVRAGEWPAYVEFWKLSGQTIGTMHVPRSPQSEYRAVPRGPRTARRLICATYQIYNAAQLDGMPSLDTRAISWSPTAEAEWLLMACDAAQADEHRIDGDSHVRRAFGPSEYSAMLYDRALATALQEMPSGGSLDAGGIEMRAGIAAMYLCCELGLPPHRTDGAYASAWIDALRTQPHELWRAARDGQSIAERVFSLSPSVSRLIERQQEALILRSTPSIQRRAVSSIGAPGLALGSQTGRRTG